ncbi:hypothetical protein H9P43_001999 [Blastocladiella emersonii ATCC 22665]|nr:hypothetical protein H9P43_001999 [Blastocladiella emersonii ATCC 22665]
MRVSLLPVVIVALWLVVLPFVASAAAKGPQYKSLHDAPSRQCNNDIGLPLRWFLEFSGPDTQVGYTVTWASDELAYNFIPQQFIERRNVRADLGRGTLLGRGWGIHPTAFSQWLGQVSVELSVRAAVSPPTKATSAAQTLIDALAQLFSRATYASVRDELPSYANSTDDAVTPIAQLANKVVANFPLDYAYTSKYWPWDPARNSTLEAMVLVRTETAKAAAKLTGLGATSAAYAKISPELDTFLRSSTSTSVPIVKFAANTAAFIKSVVNRTLLTNDRFIRFTMTTSKQVDRIQTGAGVVRWLEGPYTSFFAYVSNETPKFSAAQNCSVTGPSAKFYVSANKAAPTTLFHTANSTDLAPLFSDGGVCEIKKPFPTTKAQVVANNKFLAGVRDSFGSPSTDTIVNGKVEFEARASAKCSLPLMPFYVAEPVTCMQYSGQDLDNYYGLKASRGDAFEALLDDAAAAFATQDSFEDGLADFSIAADGFEDAAFALGGQALVQDTLDAGLVYIDY